MQNEIDLLIQQIDENPDKLHGDYTPAVHRLIEIGPPALPAVLELILSENEDTRLRAQRVIEGITMKMFGFQFGAGWKDEQSEDEWRELWKSLGGLGEQDSQEEREETVDRWREWIRSHGLTSGC